MKKIIIIGIVVIVAATGIFFLFFSSGEKEPDISYYTPGDYFVTNIKDSTRLLQVTIVLELATYDPEGTDEYLTENNQIIRDNILFILREKTEDELRSTGIEDTLREEIVAALKKEMGLGYIKTLYFNDYVIQ